MKNQHVRVELARLLIKIHKLSCEIEDYKREAYFLEVQPAPPIVPNKIVG